jgi:YgiT-type zinc finger domain-containing protein
MTDSGNTYHTCPLCRAGRLQPTRTPYVQVYENTLVQVPGVASWKCDMCGLTVFDSDAVLRIETLIDADGLPPNRHLPLPGIAPARDSVAPGDDLPEDIAPPAD